MPIFLEHPPSTGALFCWSNFCRAFRPHPPNPLQEVLWSHLHGFFDCCVLLIVVHLFSVPSLSLPYPRLPFCVFYAHQAAVDQLEAELQHGGRGAVVEYTNLPDVVTEYIYPVLFGMGNEKLEEHSPHLLEAAR